MAKYFTNIAENELNSERAQHFESYVMTPFASYQDFGIELSNIIVLPCKLFILTIASLVEALLSFAYAGDYYCRSLPDLSAQNVSDGWHSAYIGLKTFGLFLASLLYTLVFLVRLFNTILGWVFNCCNEYTPISDTRASQQLTEDNVESISRALSEYTDFIKKTGVDKDTIWQVLCEHDSELSAYDEQLATEYAKLEKSKATVTGVTHFQKTGPRTKPRPSRYAELLKEYRELVKTYPVAEFHRWTTDEERDGLSLEMVEEAHANYEAHHTKLLGIAEELLTESGVTVQRSRNIIEKIEARESKSLICGGRNV